VSGYFIDYFIDNIIKSDAFVKGFFYSDNFQQRQAMDSSNPQFTHKISK